MNVNASARQLADPQFADVVAATLAETGLPPEALGLEITESLLVEDAPTARRALQQLRDLGVRIVLDDFGTGYSSLSYLRAFPVDVLKIDRSFIEALGSGNDEAGSDGVAIVEAIITMARALGMSVVGEGVETEHQHRVLAQLGCPLGQGYFYGRPMAAFELAGSLQQRGCRTLQ